MPREFNCEFGYGCGCPAMLGVSSALAILGSNFTMNMVTLLPLTALNFFNSASKHGILVKDASALETNIATNTKVAAGFSLLSGSRIVFLHLKYAP